MMVTLETQILDIDKLLPSFSIENEHLEIMKKDLIKYLSEWQFHKYLFKVNDYFGNEHYQDYHHSNNCWGQWTLGLVIVVKRKNFANVVRVSSWMDYFGL